MNILRYVLRLQRWTLLIIIGTGLAAATAFVSISQVTPIYQASTRLLISQVSSTNSTATYQGLLNSERLARTYAELIVLDPVLNEVIQKLHLSSTPQRLASQIRVTALRNTELIEIQVTDLDPEQAALIANALADRFSRGNSLAQANNVDAVRRSLAAEQLRLERELKRMQAELDRLEATADPGAVRQMRDELAQTQRDYLTIVRRLEQLRLAELQPSNTIQVVEPAVAPTVPVYPQIISTTLLAGLVGLILMIGMALFFEYLDDNVSSLDDATTLLRTSGLAAVGQIEGARPSERLVALHDPYHTASEAYQMLRVRLEVARFEAPLRTLLVTSANPGEGKSTTAANLAVAMAQFGKHVILVDLDLRRPTLHQYFGHHNQRGLTTALLREKGADLESYQQNTKLDNLRLLPSGPLPADPMAVISSPRLATLIEELQTMVDLVIFDSPPLLPVADSTFLAHMCDATILVALAGSTRSAALQRAGELLEHSGCSLAGVVLNRVAKSDSGYGYGYHQEQRPVKRSWLARLFGGKQDKARQHHKKARRSEAAAGEAGVAEPVLLAGEAERREG